MSSVPVVAVLSVEFTVALLSRDKYIELFDLSVDERPKLLSTGVYRGFIYVEEKSLPLRNPTDTIQQQPGLILGKAMEQP